VSTTVGLAYTEHFNIAKYNENALRETQTVVVLALPLHFL